jgi:hypothetical protein
MVHRPPAFARRAALRHLPVAAAALLLLAACDRSPSEPRGEVHFETLAKTTTVTHLGPPLREVVRDQARWEVVWRELWGPSAPPRPEVDFDRAMVVAATASAECLGEVVIDGVSPERGGVLVAMGDSGPAPCLCVRGEYTFHVVRTARIEGSPAFAVRPLASRC